MTWHSKHATLVVLAALASACEVAFNPIEVASGCPAAPIRGPEQWANTPDEQLIDDFEDVDVQLPQTDGRSGAWILGSDMTSSDLTNEASERCSARGAAAGHFAGSGFTDWGANWSAVLRATEGGFASAYDAAQYDAVSFWGAISSDADQSLTLPVGITTLDVAWNGGVCTECMDYYRTEVTLTPTWQRIVVPFEALKQEGFGIPQVPLRADQLVGFIIWPEAEFDIWLDDLRFEKSAR